jgi:hypothetical protein
VLVLCFAGFADILDILCMQRAPCLDFKYTWFIPLTLLR